MVNLYAEGRGPRCPCGTRSWCLDGHGRMQVRSSGSLPAEIYQHEDIVCGGGQPRLSSDGCRMVPWVT